MIPVRHTVHRKAYAGRQRDALGNVRDTWSAENPLPVQGIAPGAMVEPDQPNRDVSHIAWTLYCPPKTDIGERDLIVLGGQEYKVAGRPKPFNLGPWDWCEELGGTVVELTRVEG